jgi:hypothetical protein
VLFQARFQKFLEGALRVPFVSQPVEIQMSRLEAAFVYVREGEGGAWSIFWIYAELLQKALGKESLSGSQRPFEKDKAAGPGLSQRQKGFGKGASAVESILRKGSL